MKAKAIQTSLNLSQREALRVDQAVCSVWQITPGSVYTVFALAVPLQPGVYGTSVMLTIVDDFEKLIPAPDGLFEIVDSRVSERWVASFSSNAFKLSPKEFVEHAFLAEDILDRDPVAARIFEQIRLQFAEDSSM